MPASGVRFLHASDFRLDQPVGGLASLPPPWRDLAREAPRKAAQEVFDLCLARQVDFLLLSGDLIDVPQAGRSQLRWLLDQFERLSAANVSIYWAPGRCDGPSVWPEHWVLPTRVVRFNSPVVREVVHERDGRPLARILGCRYSRKRPWRPEDFRSKTKGGLRIALAYGRASARKCLAQPVDFWALGGRTIARRLAADLGEAAFDAPQLPPTSANGSASYAGGYPEAVSDSNGVAAPQGATLQAVRAIQSGRRNSPDLALRGGWIGSPQGRDCDALGPHGCLLVDAPVIGPVQTQFLETDALRFREEKVSLAGVLRPEEAVGRVEAVLKSWYAPASAASQASPASVNAPSPSPAPASPPARSACAASRACVVRWVLESPLPLVRQLRHERQERAFLERLQQEYGRRTPGVWSLGVQYEPLFDEAASPHEPTLWSEFVRRWQALRVGLDRTLNLNFSALLAGEGWKPGSDPAKPRRAEPPGGIGPTPAALGAALDASGLTPLPGGSLDGDEGALAALEAAGANGRESGSDDWTALARGAGARKENDSWEENGNEAPLWEEGGELAPSQEVWSWLAQADAPASRRRVLREAAWQAWDRLHPKEPVGDPS